LGSPTFSFSHYINNYSCSGKEKEPTREDFEQFGLYRLYYSLEDKKNEIERGITSGLNNQRSPSAIEAINAEFRSDNLDVQIKFKENKNRQRTITIKKSYDDEYTWVGYQINF
jgi:hypothetical protein